MINDEKTIIHFFRHSIVHNPKEIFYGRLPGFGLSREGRDLVRNQAELLKLGEIHTIYSSPLLRARQTAHLLRQYLGLQLPIHLSTRLIEVCSPYDGQPLKDMEAKGWDIYSGNVPPYEQPQDILLRMHSFIKRILKMHTGKNLIAVTHADNIVFLKLWANHYPINYESKRKIERKQIDIEFPQPASVLTLVWDDPARIEDVQIIRE